MDTKLTLKLDKTVIEKAKEYASSHQRSLSGLIESYLQFLIEKGSSNNGEEIPVSPFVKSISSGVHIPADLDIRTEYSAYLTKKYQ
jgi:Family of unknown function (DUF6364)